MRASTLAVATLTALAAQGISQKASASDLPLNLEQPSESGQRAVSDRALPSAPIPSASLPEPQVEPQFAMTRMDSLMRSQSATPDPVLPSAAVAVPDVAEPGPLDTVSSSPIVDPAVQPVLVAQQAEIQTIPVIGPDSPAIPVGQAEPVPQPVNVSSPTYPAYGPSGVSRRRVRSSNLNFLSVTNRTSTTVEIELVGRGRPLVLRPGQTRQFAVRDRDLSLLYWVPSNPRRRDVRLAARVSQTSATSIAVTLVRSRFPSDNLAIYFPEPDSPDYTIKIF